MKTRISIMLLLFCSLFINNLTIAQETVKTIENPMDQLSFMLGKWEGESWMMTQSGKETSHTTETITCKLNCSIMVAEGLGIKTDPKTQEQKVVHDAFGVLSFDQEKKSLIIRAYKENAFTESNIEFLEAKKFRWYLDVPNGGKVRFTSDYNTENKWIEIGEFSRDGENWMQFLGMELTKVHD